MFRVSCLKTLPVFLLLVSSTLARAEFVYDTVKLTPQIRALIDSDLKALHQLKFRPDVAPAFQLFFKGSSAEDIEHYLDERIHYIGADLDDQGELEASSFGANYAPSFLRYHYRSQVLLEKDVSAPLLSFSEDTIAISHPRVGFMGIGLAYLDEDSTLMDRLDTWVHEARHSDCAHIPSHTDLALIVRNQNQKVSPEGLACTHLHVPCQSGGLKGELACDAHPWGAYSAGYLFSKAVYQSCTNCSQKDRQDALASATENLTRLTSRVKHFMKMPKLPAPDMSSFDDHE